MPKERVLVVGWGSGTVPTHTQMYFCRSKREAEEFYQDLIVRAESDKREHRPLTHLLLKGKRLKGERGDD